MYINTWGSSRFLAHSITRVTETSEKDLRPKKKWKGSEKKRETERERKFGDKKGTKVVGIDARVLRWSGQCWEAMTLCKGPSLGRLSISIRPRTQLSYSSISSSSSSLSFFSHCYFTLPRTWLRDCQKDFLPFKKNGQEPFYSTSIINFPFFSIQLSIYRIHIFRKSFLIYFRFQCVSSHWRNWRRVYLRSIFLFQFSFPLYCIASTGYFVVKTNRAFVMNCLTRFLVDNK